MPKREEDKPVSLFPLSFKEAIQRLVKTPPVTPAKQKKRRKKKSANSE
jgi:hypothetical protein